MFGRNTDGSVEGTLSAFGMQLCLKVDGSWGASLCFKVSVFAWEGQWAEFKR